MEFWVEKTGFTRIIGSRYGKCPSNILRFDDRNALIAQPDILIQRGAGETGRKQCWQIKPFGMSRGRGQRRRSFSG